MIKPFIKPGATVWLLDRKRVRDGIGPQQVVVAEIAKDAAGADTNCFRVAGTRGWYVDTQAFLTENEARLEWFTRAQAEIRNETSRFNKIVGKLSAWERVAGEAR